MRETKQDKQPLFLGKHTPGEDQSEGERAKEKTNYRRLQEKISWEGIQQRKKMTYAAYQFKIQ